MDADRQAAIIANDLDSLIHRIESLPAHPEYTNALVAVQQAKEAIVRGRSGIHQAGLRRRHGQPVAFSPRYPAPEGTGVDPRDDIEIGALSPSLPHVTV